jgi:integrase
MTGNRKRANGQGHTYREKNSWRTVIRHEGHIVSASARTEAESRRLAKLKVARLVASGVARATLAQSLTVAEFFPVWLDEQHRQKVAHGTYLRYRGLLHLYVLPALGTMRLAKVTKADINRFLDSMELHGAGRRTQQQTRALLSVGFKAALDAELASNNPVRDARRPHAARKPITPLTLEETRRVLQAHEGTFMFARLHVALLCGLRQGEALGLEWADVDLDRGSIRVHKQAQRINGTVQFARLKTPSSVRTVMLPEATRLALVEHRNHIAALATAAGEKWIPNDLVFPNKYGGIQQSKWDYRRWHVALEACGIEARSLHSARHTSGTLMYSQSVDVETIRRTLGHSSVLVTSSIYVHAADEPLRAAASKLNALMVNE